MFIDSAVVVASSAATNLMCQAALSALKHSSALTHTRTGTHTHSHTLTRTCCCEAFISSLFLVLFIVFFCFVVVFLILWACRVTPASSFYAPLLITSNSVWLGLYQPEIYSWVYSMFFFFFELGVLGALRFLMLMLLFISGKRRDCVPMRQPELQKVSFGTNLCFCRGCCSVDESRLRPTPALELELETELPPG